MKIIIASIKPFQLEEVRNALNAIGVPGSYRRRRRRNAGCRGFGVQTGAYRLASNAKLPR